MFSAYSFAFAIAVWLLLLLLAFIDAAFKNRDDVLTSFFKGTEEWISYMFEVYVVGYLKPHGELFEWFIGTNKD